MCTRVQFGLQECKNLEGSGQMPNGGGVVLNRSKGCDTSFCKFLYVSFKLSYKFGGTWLCFDDDGAINSISYFTVFIVDFWSNNVLKNFSQTVCLFYGFFF